MSDGSGIDVATKRLSLALDALAAAVDRRHGADRAADRLAEQLHVAGTDRARLAHELDTAAARSRRLVDANREIARRLDTAIDTIHSVLDGHEG